MYSRPRWTSATAYRLLKITLNIYWLPTMWKSPVTWFLVFPEVPREMILCVSDFSQSGDCKGASSLLSSSMEWESWAKMVANCTPLWCAQIPSLRLSNGSTKTTESALLFTSWHTQPSLTLNVLLWPGQLRLWPVAPEAVHNEHTHTRGSIMSGSEAIKAK